MANARAHTRKMTLAFASIVTVSLLSGCDSYRLAGWEHAQSPEAEAAGKLHQCGACHGGDGNSNAEIFPNLAGQQKDYIAAQLTAFREHTRQDRDAKAYMWGIATGLSDAIINALAEDYSAKSPAAAIVRPQAEVAVGEKIFNEGIPESDVPACAACHGEQAEGNGAIPRLAGQHRDYMIVQLAALASGARENAIMNPIAKNMAPDKIKAVAAYLSSL